MSAEPPPAASVPLTSNTDNHDMETDHGGATEERKEEAASSAAAAAGASTAAAAAGPSAAQPLTTTVDIPPNQTLYVNNLNEKIKKDELKKALYLVFSAYGNIVEINVSTTYRMRGQAWVVFDQLSSATRAQRELQNFLFFGKPMRITFARAKSDTIARLDGTYAQRAKRKQAPDDKDLTKPRKGGPVAKKAKKDGGEKKAKAAAAAAAAPAAPAPAAPVAAPASLEPPPPPHRILFVEQLPAAATDLMLGMLFQQYPGFKEARVIPGKQVAFVEFAEVEQAATAMDALQGFKITQQNLMKITFAKK
jgi:RNA recognition motif-containing protein